MKSTQQRKDEHSSISVNGHCNTDAALSCINVTTTVWQVVGVRDCGIQLICSRSTTKKHNNNQITTTGAEHNRNTFHETQVVLLY